VDGPEKPVLTNEMPAETYINNKYISENEERYFCISEQIL
jgi:hypothetical protein